MNEKLLKLLRLSERATGPEAELALARAQELATAHNIDLATLDTSEGERVVQEPFTSEKMVRKEKEGLATLIIWLLQSHFRVQFIFTSKYNFETNTRDTIMTLIGRHSDTVLANYLYGWLRDHFIRSWNERGPSPDGKRRSAITFWYGMYQAIDAKLTAARTVTEADRLNPANAGKYQLALVSEKEALAAEIFRQFGKVRSASVRFGAGRAAVRLQGWKAGQATNLPGLPLNAATASALQ